MRYSITSNFKNLSMNCKKCVFHCEKWIWTHYEFCAYGRSVGFREDPEQKYQLWCITKADNMWNENTLSASLHLTIISWTRSKIYVNVNVFSVIRNDFGHALIGLICKSQLMRLSCSPWDWDQIGIKVGTKHVIYETFANLL